MKKVLYVFGVIECRRVRGGLVGFLEVARFPGIYSFEDAEAAEVWKGDLELADSLCTGNVILRLASLALLLDLAHLAGTLKGSEWQDWLRAEVFVERSRKMFLRGPRISRCQDFVADPCVNTPPGP